ncbi:MAG: hypothetical protein AAF436_14030 [Myxococcota bacterium]
MTAPGDKYETPRGRTLWLALGFAVLIALGVVTVLMPELENEPESESATSQGSDDTSDENDKPPQD